jgi:hypothetical protein
MAIIRNKVTSFQLIVETKEYSISIFACISDKREEFIKDINVNIDIIPIANNVRLS